MDQRFYQERGWFLIYNKIVCLHYISSYCSLNAYTFTSCVIAFSFIDLKTPPLKTEKWLFYGVRNMAFHEESAHHKYPYETRK